LVFVTGGQWLERLVLHAMGKECALYVMENYGSESTADIHVNDF
jgi:hypothetical protein